MFIGILVAAFCVCAGGAGDPQPAASLPSVWHGTWTGKMMNTGAAGQSSEVPMTFRIEPIPGTGDLTWAITYGQGDRALPRNYKLVPVADQLGRFRIDEGNGVALDARLVNGVMYSQFATGTAVLTARYELRGSTLHYELTSAKPVAEKVGGGRIQAYSVDVIQAAELKKK